MLETSSTSSRRENGKAERRRRIVEAAAALARRSGFDDVSMVAIAQRAEVSPATVYNLFQSKGAIFRQVFDLDIEEYAKAVGEAPAADALERIFVGVEQAAELYRRDPVFYRAMAKGGGGFGGEHLGAAINEPRVAFWQAQVAAAVAERRLRPDTDANLLGATLMQFMRGVFLEWAAGAISVDRLVDETAYGFALALLAYAADETAPSLRGRLAVLQARLAGGRKCDPEPHRGPAPR